MLLSSVTQSPPSYPRGPNTASKPATRMFTAQVSRMHARRNVSARNIRSRMAVACVGGASILSKRRLRSASVPRIGPSGLGMGGADEERPVASRGWRVLMRTGPSGRGAAAAAVIRRKRAAPKHLPLSLGVCEPSGCGASGISDADVDETTIYQSTNLRHAILLCNVSVLCYH